MKRLLSDTRVIAIIPPAASLAVILLLCLLAPLLPLKDPVAMDIGNRLAPPGAGSLLGTDAFGRDILSRLLWGGMITLYVAFLSSIIAAIVGVGLALIGAYYGGIFDTIALRFVDIVLSFPTILLALLAVAMVGPSVPTLILVLALLNMPGFTRVAYGEVRRLRHAEFVDAARVLGQRGHSILLGTILPNILPPLLVQFSLTVAAAILVESGLSFLGLGVVPPSPSWGGMIRDARASLEHSTFNLVWPCLALTVTVLVLNWLCDTLRDSLDARAIVRREGN